MLPALSEADVAEFERRHLVTLPAGYRDFLVAVSSGGVGPAYGLLTLDKALVVDGPSHDLTSAFPWTEAHNPYTVGPDLDDATYGRQTSGTLALCDEGCGYYHRLVVSGPTRGMMWMDGRCSDQGFVPLGVDFLSWYRRWIEDVRLGGKGIWWMSPI